MKITQYAPASAFDVDACAEPLDRLRDRITRRVDRAVAAISASRARRRRLAQLMSLDDRILRDIGIGELEIRDLRVRRQLLPPSWVD